MKRWDTRANIGFRGQHDGVVWIADDVGELAEEHGLGRQRQPLMWMVSTAQVCQLAVLIPAVRANLCNWRPCISPTRCFFKVS